MSGSMIIDGVTLDTSRLETLALTSGLTAGTVGAFAVLIGKEPTFVKPFMYVATASSFIHYVMPTSDNMTRSGLVGAAMAVQCAVLADGDAFNCLKYGAVAAAANYIATQYLMPELQKLYPTI